MILKISNVTNVWQFSRHRVIAIQNLNLISWRKMMTLTVKGLGMALLFSLFVAGCSEDSNITNFLALF